MDRQPHQVALGLDVCISQGAYLFTGNHDWDDPLFRFCEPITVANGAWVGAKAIICPGSVLAPLSVIGAGVVRARPDRRGGPCTRARRWRTSAGSDDRRDQCSRNAPILRSTHKCAGTAGCPSTRLLAAPGAHAFQPSQDLLVLSRHCRPYRRHVLLRISSLGLTFLLSIVLAKALGSAGYGIYVLCMTWATLLSTLATPTAQRRGPRDGAGPRDQRPQERSAALPSSPTRSLSWVAATCRRCGRRLGFSRALPRHWRALAWRACHCRPFDSLGVRRGGDRRCRAATSDLERPDPRDGLSAVGIAGALLGAWLTGACSDVDEALWRSISSRPARPCCWPSPSPTPSSAGGNGRISSTWPTSQDWRAWLRAGVVLMANQLLLNAMPQIDILMLGWLAGTGEVGVSRRLPRRAAHHPGLRCDERRRCADHRAPLGRRPSGRVQKLVTSCARTTFSVAVLVGAALVLVPKPPGVVRPRVRSRRARHGDSAGRVARRGRMRTCPILLIMTGFERAALTAVGAGVMGNVALNALLIPAAGVTGAAAATPISVVFYHLALCRAAYRLTGIQTHCLASSNSATMTS